MGLYLHHHRQIVLRDQLVGAGCPLQGAGDIVRLFSDHAQLPVSPGYPLDVARILKYFPGLVVPVRCLIIELLLMEQNSKLAALVAGAPAITQLLFSFQGGQEPLFGFFVNYAPVLLE